MTTTTTMRHTACLAAVVIALCAAAGLCGAAGSQEPDQAESTAKARLELRYAKGDGARYEFEQSSLVAIKGIPGVQAALSGQPFDIQAKGVVFEKLVDITDDGNYEIKTGFERAHVLQGERALSFQGSDLPSATVVLSKTGELIATKTAHPGIPLVARQPWASKARPLSSWVVFPGKEVSVGSLWTTQVSLPWPGLTGESPKVEVGYELSGFEDLQGSECARILMRAEGPLEAKGVAVYGASADVTLDFATVATAWVRVSDGRLVRIEVSERLSMVGVLGAEQEGETRTGGGQIEMGAESSATVELIPSDG